MQLVTVAFISLAIIAWLLWSDYRQQFRFNPHKVGNYAVLVVPWVYGALAIGAALWSCVVAGWRLAAR